MISATWALDKIKKARELFDSNFITFDEYIKELNRIREDSELPLLPRAQIEKIRASLK